MASFLLKDLLNNYGLLIQQRQQIANYKVGRILYFYFVYGLGIHSEQPLLGLSVLREVAGDVILRQGNLNYSQEKVIQGQQSLDCSLESLNLQYNIQQLSYFSKNLKKVSLDYFEEIGKFLILNRQEVIMDSILPGLGERALSSVILKYILPKLIHQREQLILHANAVAMLGKAVVFLGNSGAGKSTTTAALCNLAGHNVLSDDAVVVQIDKKQSPKVFPGSPQILLLPETSTALGYHFNKLPQNYPYSEKRSLCISNREESKPLPLKRIYLLTEGSCHKIEPLSSQEAFNVLIHSAYFSIFSKDKSLTKSLFQQCADLANLVTVCRLIRPRSLSLLPDLVKLIEEDVAKLD